MRTGRNSFFELGSLNKSSRHSSVEKTCTFFHQLFKDILFLYLSFTLHDIGLILSRRPIKEVPNFNLSAPTSVSLLRPLDSPLGQ